MIIEKDSSTPMIRDDDFIFTKPLKIEVKRKIIISKPPLLKWSNDEKKIKIMEKTIYSIEYIQ